MPLSCEGKKGYRVSDPDDIGTVRLVGWFMRVSCPNSTYSLKKRRPKKRGKAVVYLLNQHSPTDKRQFTCSIEDWRMDQPNLLVDMMAGRTRPANTNESFHKDHPVHQKPET